MTPDAYEEMLDLISHYENLIKKQNETITRLVNENAEKENLINELIGYDMQK